MPRSLCGGDITILGSLDGDTAERHVGNRSLGTPVVEFGKSLAADKKARSNTQPRPWEVGTETVGGWNRGTGRVGPSLWEVGTEEVGG